MFAVGLLVCSVFIYSILSGLFNIVLFREVFFFFVSSVLSFFKVYLDSPCGDAANNGL